MIERAKGTRLTSPVAPHWSRLPSLQRLPPNLHPHPWRSARRPYRQRNLAQLRHLQPEFHPESHPGRLHVSLQVLLGPTWHHDYRRSRHHGFLLCIHGSQEQRPKSRLHLRHQLLLGMCLTPLSFATTDPKTEHLLRHPIRLHPRSPPLSSPRHRQRHLHRLEQSYGHRQRWRRYRRQHGHRCADLHLRCAVHCYGGCGGCLPLRADGQQE
jgi:hypothetical protein